MRILYLDIENTVIDSLMEPYFMDANIKRIRRFIETFGPQKVCLFTWGWKTIHDIEPELINNIFDELRVEGTKRGEIYVKEDSVDAAIREGWLIQEDKERAMEPGMMAEFGISKPSCFQLFCQTRPFDTSVLIDDLVDGPTNDNYQQLMHGSSQMLNPVTDL